MILSRFIEKLASANHPDKGGNTEMMQLINTALPSYANTLKLTKRWILIGMITNQRKALILAFWIR